MRVIYHREAGTTVDKNAAAEVVVVVVVVVVRGTGSIRSSQR